MRYWHLILTYLVITAILAFTVLSTFASERVYFRGLSFPNPCGNVFADGLNEMAKATGDKSNSWCSRSLVVDAIIKRHARGKLREPVHIIGHSLGANSALIAARQLSEAGIQVGFVGAFDPTVSLKVVAPSGTYVFLSKDFRATPQLGANNLEYPNHNHLSITKDRMIQRFVKGKLDGN